MELRVLRYFLTVAREESISHAAEKLHLTQPTLSRQLMQLEEELGAQLLIRNKRKIGLTDAGMLLRQRAEELVTLSERTEKEFREQDNFIGGNIAIGSVESMTSQILADLIKDFHGSYPQASFHIFSGIADDIKDRIDKGLLDIGILLEPVNIDKYDFVRIPHAERWGALMKKTSHLAEKEAIVRSDLVGMPLFMSNRQEVKNEFTSWFGDDYERLHILATFNLISNIMPMVEKDIGTAICIESVLTRADMDRLCFRPFTPEFLSRAVIVWQKNKVFSPTVNRFIKTVKDTFQA